jgi:Na+/melibiose symporter-like transporter
LFGIPALRSGLGMLLVQNLVLLGLFFTIPLYLQIVLGQDAFQTGVRLLPVSITMLLTSMSGPLLGRFLGPRQVVRLGLVTLFVAVIWLLATVQPTLDERSFGFAMALLGIGMGLLASQLGNVVQSSVGESERSEVGGLQYTAQNLGSSLGTALIGAVLLAALAGSVTRYVINDPRISDAVEQQATRYIGGGIPFVPITELQTALAATPIPPAEAQALVESYSHGQLIGLKVALLAAALLVLCGFGFTRNLPNAKLSERR